MSFPTEIDFGQIMMGDGAGPEVFTTICGIENGTVNQTANTNDVFRRDCAKPGKLPSRKVKVSSKQWDITASGVGNVAQIALLMAAIGISKNYKVPVYKRDGTDAGELLGTYSGQAVLTANNVSFSQEEGTGEITLAGENELLWTPAP